MSEPDYSDVVYTKENIDYSDDVIDNIDIIDHDINIQSDPQSNIQDNLKYFSVSNVTSKIPTNNIQSIHELEKMKHLQRLGAATFVGDSKMVNEINSQRCNSEPHLSKHKISSPTNSILMGGRGKAGGGRLNRQFSRLQVQISSPLDDVDELDINNNTNNTTATISNVYGNNNDNNNISNKPLDKSLAAVNTPRNNKNTDNSNNSNNNNTIGIDIVNAYHSSDLQPGSNNTSVIVNTNNDITSALTSLNSTTTTYNNNNSYSTTNSSSATNSSSTTNKEVTSKEPITQTIINNNHSIAKGKYLSNIQTRYSKTIPISPQPYLSSSYIKSSSSSSINIKSTNHKQQQQVLVTSKEKSPLTSFSISSPSSLPRLNLESAITPAIDNLNDDTNIINNPSTTTSTSSSVKDRIKSFENLKKR